MTIFVLVFLPLVIGLGFWQLERGAEKRQMEFQYMSKITELPVAPEESDLGTPFQRLRLSGSYGDEIFLVDNQVSEGRTGYWIVQLFIERSGSRFLVNRGFIAGLSVRTELPHVATPSEPVTLTGVVWPFTGLIPVLDDDVWPDLWPRRVQRLDIVRMASLVDASPVEVRLEAGQPGVASAAPFASVLSDGKHRGYAATWFGLAAALLVLFLIFGVKRAREQRDS